MSGNKDVGMHPLNVHGYWRGKTMLPRLVNQELDREFELRMNRLEREILEKLQDMIFRHDRGRWTSMFLTIFIFLHGLERDTWNMNAWEYEVNKLGGPKWPLRNKPGDFYKQNQHIADLLVANFRIICKGHTPLTLDINSPRTSSLVDESGRARRLISIISEDLKSLENGKIYIRDQFGRYTC